MATSALEGLVPRRVVREAKWVLRATRIEEVSAPEDLRRSEVVSHCWISASSVGEYVWDEMAAMMRFLRALGVENRLLERQTLRSVGRKRRRENSLNAMLRSIPQWLGVLVME